MFDMLEAHHGATSILFIHDAGIEGYMAFAVGETSISYCLIIGICFGDLYAGFYSIQRRTTTSKGFPGFGIGFLTKIPGGDHNGIMS